MGQALSSETHSIPGGDGYKYWVGLNMKAFRGCKKTVYRGILLGSGPRWGENVVVKAFTDVCGTRENWRFEVDKANVARQMVTMYKDCRYDNSNIRVVNPSIVQMDKVSKVNKWLNQRKGSTTICQNDWVSVEEYVPGEFRRFSPWTTVHEKRVKREADHLSVFSHFTYMKSHGNFVVCDFQGVINEEDGKQSFVITDAIIHSLRKEYGPFDAGDHGITEFFKLHRCDQVCRGWPVPEPSSPPPPFSSLPLTPPPAFEDIVFPVPRTPISSHQENPWNRSYSARFNRRRHATGDGSPIRTCQTSSNILEMPENGRDRSNSAVRPAGIQRSRFSSERHSLAQANLSPLLIPTAPPAYEDCVEESWSGWR